MSGTDPERAISTGLLALEEKVREAVKLLTSLREKNIELSTELGELKGELESSRFLLAKSGTQASYLEKSSKSKRPSTSGGGDKLSHEVKQLRAEREVVRDKVNRILKELEKLQA